MKKNNDEIRSVAEREIIPSRGTLFYPPRVGIFSRRVCMILTAAFLLTVGVFEDARAQTFIVEPSLSRVEASIGYSLVGTYQVRFDNFSGVIHYDPDDIENSSVKMDIDVNSLRSPFSGLDRIAKSSKGLDAALFPLMQFESLSVYRLEDQHYTRGQFFAHGVVRIRTFSFDLTPPRTDSRGESFIEAKGSWVINRKDFNVIWNKLLDKGGIIVGNHVTIDWKIIAYQAEEDDPSNADGQ